MRITRNLGATGIAIAGGLVLSACSAVSITGDAGRFMEPGIDIPLDLAVTNVHGLPIEVSALSVAIVDVSAPFASSSHPCSAADYVVRQAPRSFELDVSPASTTHLSSTALPRRSWPSVGMRLSQADQSGCRGARVTLDYSASTRLVLR